MKQMWKDKAVGFLHLPFGGTVHVRYHSMDLADGVFHVRVYDKASSRIYAGFLNSHNDLFCNGRLLGRLVYVGRG